MASKTCITCHRSYPAELAECPHCHPASATPEEEVQTISEDDILEILEEDLEAQNVLADESASGFSAEVVDIAEVKESGAEEQLTDIVEIVDEGSAPAATGEETFFMGGPSRVPPLVPDEPTLVTKPPAADAASPPASEAGGTQPPAPEAGGQPPAPEEPKQPLSPKATTIRPKMAAQTTLKSKVAAQTTLRPKVAAPTRLASKQGGGMTQLAGTDEPMEIPSAPEGGEAGTIQGLDTLIPAEEVPPVPDRGAASNEVDILEEMLAGESSIVDLGKKAEPPSGVDAIAEELESQTDLAKKAALEGHDSAVDLGGKAAVPSEALIDFGEARQPDADGAIEVGAADLLRDDEAIEVGATDLLKDDEAVEVGAADLWPEGEPAEVGDEAEMVSLQDLVEETPGKKKKKKKKKVADEAIVAVVGAPEEVGVGAAPEPLEERPVRQRRPRYGRRWLGGTLIGILLSAAAVVGVWFWQPDILQNYIKEHQNYKQKPPPPPPNDHVALQAVVSGNYDDALNILPKTGGTQEDMAIRGQALYLKYLKDNKGKAINPDDPDLK
jgi:hypothetical protein